MLAVVTTVATPLLLLFAELAPSVALGPELGAENVTTTAETTLPCASRTVNAGAGEKAVPISALVPPALAVIVAGGPTVLLSAKVVAVLGLMRAVTL